MVSLEQFNKISLNHKLKKKKVMIGTSFREAPQSITYSGSLTLEAALVFPIVLFVLVTFMFFFRILQVQQLTAEALATAGSRIALEAAETDKASILYAKAIGYFHRKLLETDLPMKYVKGGRTGFRLEESKLDGEYIELKISYRISLPTGMFGIKDIPVGQQLKVKKWIGFDGSKAEIEQGQWAYITPNGFVYHLKRDCTHLQLSIASISEATVNEEKYSPCQLCGQDNNLGGSCYITQEGERYHRRLDCSGLKRTIYMIRISEISGKDGCSRCGG